MVKKLNLLTGLVIIPILLTGCETKQDVPEEIHIKVLASNASEFNTNYGNYFIATHPNADLTVVSLFENTKPGSDLNKSLLDLIQKEKPDVVSLSMEFIEYLQSQGMLASLSDQIKDSKLDVSNFTPAVSSLLKDDQDQYFGLTPSFVGQALYYNKKLFDANGIAYPSNNPTWDEVFELSQRFAKPNSGKPTFAYYDKSYSNPFMMSLNIGIGSGLSFYSNHTFTFNTKSWENVFNQVVTCVKTEQCYKRPESHAPTDRFDIAAAEMENYPFLAGNVAMAVDDSNLYNKLVLNKDRYKNIDWGLVKLPVNPESPGSAIGPTLNHVFSILKESQNQEGAWELIHYLTGDDFAKLLPRINNTDLPVREPAGMSGEQLNTAPFYMLDHSETGYINRLRGLPIAVIYDMETTSQKNMASALSGEITVKEALENMNGDLQASLKLAENP